MLNSSAFAIAAGVVAVGATAAGTAVSMSAADRAAKAQGAAGKKLTKQTKNATQRFLENQEELKKQIAEIDPNINIPAYNLANATAEGIDSANAITENTIRQLKNITGRDPTQVIGNALDTLAKWENRLSNEYVQVQRGVPLVDQQQAVVSELIQGNLPQVTLQRISQNLAERGGAGFSMQAAGRSPFIQSPQAMLAENIRQSSEERMMRGLALAPGITQQRSAIAGATSGLAGQAGNLSNIARGWMDTAQSFISPVFGSMQLAAQGRAQDIERKIAKAEMINQMNAAEYNALTGQAQTGYGVAQQGIQSTLASRQAVGQGIQSIGSATAGALMGVGGAYAQMGAAQAGGTTYGSLAAAQQAAPYAAGYSQMGQNNFVPKAQAVYG